LRTLRIRRIAGAVAPILRGTITSCLRYRVTGLAAEVAFFALVSLPPLVLGLVAALGFFPRLLQPGAVEAIRVAIVSAASAVLSEQAVREVVRPVVNDVLDRPRIDILTIGFAVALWSGSRAMSIYVDTITIAYGLSGHRGIVRTKVLSFGLYAVGLVVGVVTVPLALAGPSLATSALPPQFAWVGFLYWPLLTVLSVMFLATLYHLSLPVRPPWRRALPGAILALAVWIVMSVVLRWYLGLTVAGVGSIYGPLAAPVAVLFWLYVTALAVLIGATLNAEIDRLAATTEVPNREERD
jgi:membrane protein